MTAIEYVDRVPPGWFVLDVSRKGERGADWVAVLIDIDPDDFRARRREAGGFCCFRIPGRYRSRDAAYDALEEMMATRH